MGINWKVRLKNKAFWVAIIPAMLLVIQTVAALFGFTEIGGLPALGKSVCIGLMLLGRVEIFSALLFACFVGERLRRRW